MRHLFTKKCILLCTSVLLAHVSFSQQKTAKWGSVAQVQQQLAQLSNDQGARKSNLSKLVLPLPDNTSLNTYITTKTITGTGYQIAAGGNDLQSTLRIDLNGSQITGLYTSLTEKKAYEIYTDELTGDVFVKEKAIEKVVCVDYKEHPDNSKRKAERPLRTTAIPSFQSLPGAAAVIYIDLDGEVSTSSYWANGQTINAVSFNFTDAEIKTIWEIAAQDYLTFNVNVTTDLSVFQAAAKNRRMRCICTPTNTAAPSAGGVAMISSFSWNDDTPCWVFNDGAKTCGETVSHEVGHAVGLNHDGTPSQGYYMGHADWAPIMGSSYTKAVGHWSIGEYTGANNQEDDLKIIGTQNGFTAKTDDIGNTTAAAKMLEITASGTVTDVSNRGIINNRTDIDLFKFTAALAGNVNLTIKPFSSYPNLNIKARLLDANGQVVVTSDPTTGMSATITSAVQAGTYYIEIDGVGNGANPQIGYSDYCSIGDYYISGTAPSPDPKPVAAFEFNKSKGCEGETFKFTDKSINTPSSWSWTFTGGIPATSTSQNPSVTYGTKGIYDVVLKVSNAFGNNTVTKLKLINIDGASVPAVTSDTACLPSAKVTLTATTSDISNKISWYKELASTTLLAAGNTYSPQISANTVYYVSASTVLPLQSTGAKDNTIGTGASHTGGQSLVFDAYKTFTLKTAVIYATGAKDRTLQVTDSSGKIIITKVLSLKDGSNNVTLDIEIPAGNNYKIGFPTGSDLYRNDAGAVYPYTIADLVSITGNSAGTTAPNYYYFLYNWVIQEKGGCESEKTQASASLVNCKPIVNITDPIANTVISSNATFEIIAEASTELGNITKVEFYANNVLIGTSTQQPFKITWQSSAIGSVNLTAKAITTEAANNTSSNVAVNISSTTDLNDQAGRYGIEVFPNPNEGNLNIQSLNEEITVIEIYNMQGKLLAGYSKAQIQDPHHVHLAHSLETGMYIIKINNKPFKIEVSR